MLIYAVYLANILVAGYVGITSLFFPTISSATIFQSSYQTTDIIRLVGCLWLSIAICSLFGLWRPLTFSPVLLIQLIYKASWLIVVVFPALQRAEPFPMAMSLFFLVWVIVLPFAIPFSAWLKS